MENHSLTINISKNISNQCFRSRTSGRTDVLKLSLIIMRCHIELKAIRNCWETLAIVGNWQLGNAGNKELAIRGILWQSGNSGNLQGNPQAIVGIYRQSGNAGNPRQCVYVGNSAIRECGNRGIRKRN